MNREPWPPLERAVNALRARARHGTVMPFGRRKAARVLAELERLEALIARVVIERDQDAAQVAAVRALCDDADAGKSGHPFWSAFGTVAMMTTTEVRAVLSTAPDSAVPTDTAPTCRKCGTTGCAEDAESGWYDDPADLLVAAPGFGVTNRSYWPASWVRAQEAEDANRTHGYGDFTPPGKGAPSCTCKCGATSGPVESDLAAQQWWAQHRAEVEEDRRRP